jgi:hypothetical protein
VVVQLGIFAVGAVEALIASTVPGVGEGLGASEPLESRVCVRPIVDVKTKIPQAIAHRRNTDHRF